LIVGLILQAIQDGIKMKNFIISKTVWFGILNLIVAVALYFQGIVGGAELFTLNGLLVIVLRALTNQPIGLK
jgi:hypothetical protein